MNKEFGKGQRVMVRDNDKDEWVPGLFVRKQQTSIHPYIIQFSQEHTAYFQYCISFDEIELWKSIEGE